MRSVSLDEHSIEPDHRQGPALPDGYAYQYPIQARVGIKFLF
jgi:hypothetical protein